MERKHTTRTVIYGTCVKSDSARECRREFQQVPRADIPARSAIHCLVNTMDPVGYWIRKYFQKYQVLIEEKLHYIGA
jgi:hypothetical protein